MRALGNTPRYFVPLGVKAWFTGLGLTNVVEGACVVGVGPVHTPAPSLTPVRAPPRPPAFAPRFPQRTGGR